MVTAMRGSRDGRWPPPGGTCGPVPMALRPGALRPRGLRAVSLAGSLLAAEALLAGLGLA